MQGTQDSVAILRASGTNWDARAVLGRHGLSDRAPNWSAGAIGDRTEAGKSGFNLVVAKAHTRAELLQRTHAWLQEHRALVADIAAACVHGRFIVLLDDTSSEPGREEAPSLMPGDLALLANAGIEVRVLRGSDW